MSKILELLEATKQAERTQIEQAEEERRAHNLRFVAKAVNAIVTWCGDFWPEIEPYVGEAQPKYVQGSSCHGHIEEYVLPVAGLDGLSSFKLRYDNDHNRPVDARIGYDHYRSVQELLAGAHDQFQRDRAECQRKEEEQAKAEEKNCQVQALYDQCRQFYTAWWNQAQSIIERNKAVIAEYQEQLDSEYTTTVIHYGVQDDGRQIVELSVNTLGRDNDGYWRVLEYSDQVVRRKFMYISATDAPVKRRVSVDGVELQIWRRSDRNLEQYYSLRYMPGADQATILAHAELLLVEVPSPPVKPNSLSWGDVDRIVRELRNGQSEEETIPF